MTSTNTHDEIDRWFSEYFQAFIAIGAMKKDPRVILDYWGVPLHSSDPEKSRWLTSPEEVVDVLSKMQGILKDKGYTETVILDKKISVYNVNAGRIDALMSRRGAGAAEVDRAAVSFEIRRTDRAWIIISTTALPTQVATLKSIW
jgi:hypothetical protein